MGFPGVPRFAARILCAAAGLTENDIIKPFWQLFFIFYISPSGVPRFASRILSRCRGVDWKQIIWIPLRQQAVHFIFLHIAVIQASLMPPICGRGTKIRYAHLVRCRGLDWKWYYKAILAAFFIFYISPSKQVWLSETYKIKKVAWATFIISISSGYQDSNLGPPAPKAGALTGLCYTPKRFPFGIAIAKLLLFCE